MQLLELGGQLPSSPVPLATRLVTRLRVQQTVT